MQFDREPPRLGYRGSIGSRAQGFVGKVLTVVAAGVMLAGAIAMSIVLFAIALVAILAFGGYVWWKLRKLRRQTQGPFPQPGPFTQPGPFKQGDVIEGVVVREVKTPDR
ncbi:hypothetical protein [Povalibacter sp.]|uniref:hypothetical protein n=1 Tax=Povalibacter sp. TaxID=1962978 RepID=UPI002F3F0678